MRVFYGGLSNETNAFSPIPCGEPDFVPFSLTANEAVRGALFAPLLACGAQIVEGVNLVAQPAGPIEAKAYRALRDRLIAEIEQGGPFDAVLLNLHGAMAAQDVDDCEADILRRVRDIVGPGAFLGAVLDPHCHMSAAMVAHADVLTVYKEYPHTDIGAATLQLFEISAAWLEQRFEIRRALVGCDQIDIYYTDTALMRRLVADLHRMEADPKVLSAAFVHGFPWGDTPDLGSKALVYTIQDQGLAERLAEEIAGRASSLRGQCGPKTLSARDAVRRSAVLEGLSVLADVADNAGGGAPSDSTFIVHELLAGAPLPAAVAAIWDPAAVHQAFAAGLGARLSLSIGGKHGAISGPPVAGEVTVTGLKRNHVEPAPGYGGLMVGFGDLAAVQVGAVTLVLSTLRSQAFSPEIFAAVGVEIADQRVLVVKSTQHFRSGFDPVAARTFYVDTPGALSFNFPAVPYVKAPRTLWPLSTKRHERA